MSIKDFAKKATPALAIVGGVGMGLMAGSVAFAADEFNASGTQAILTNALSVPQTVLAWGIPIILGIVLGVWAIFWLVGKLRKHTK
jgi:hypothetical protein